MNGGPIVDIAGHYFDFICFLTGEDGLIALKVSLAAIESIRTGEVIGLRAGG